MPWIDVEQNTDEWMDLRVGRIGGSTIGKIMANYGKAFGNPAKDAATRIALEKIRGKSFEDGYSNAHMERGHEQEPIARKLYEDTYFCDVSNGGYYALNEDMGCSPDGLVYYDGVVEIKSVIETVHFSTIKRGAFDPSYKWQLLFNLSVASQEEDRRWIDYVEFCSTFPEGKKLFVQRITRDEYSDEYTMMRTRLSEFRDLVSEKMAIIEAL